MISSASLARKHNLKYATVQSRKRKGLKGSDLIAPISNNTNGKSITIRGITFPSCRAAARYYKIDHNVLCKRRWMGVTGEDLIRPLRRVRKYLYRKPWASSYNVLVLSCKKRELKLKINFRQYTALREKHTVCQILKIPFDMEKERFGTNYRLDRVNNKKSYTLSNVKVVSSIWNYHKGSATESQAKNDWNEIVDIGHIS